MNEDAIMMMLQQAMQGQGQGPQPGGLSGINLQDPQARPTPGMQPQIDPMTGQPIQLPVPQPQAGPGIEQQLQQLQPNMGGFSIDPTNTKRLVQGRWRF